ncbi:MAG: GAF domain-containing protein [Anaerolineae bacterium]|nr:GAF domain-containing protein [Anaerolineae bacterium]
MNQAAIAYENARKMHELEHMRQAAEALAHADGLTAVLNQIVLSACQVLQADSAVIWSYDASRLEFMPNDSIAWGIPEDVWRRSRKQGPRPGGTTDTVLQMGWLGMEDVDDLTAYPFMGDSTLLLLRGTGVRSFQAVALRVGDEKLGALYVNYNHPKTFTTQEQEIAQTFANHAALALRNARLLAQLEQARVTTTLIADATTLADLPETLDAVAAGIYRAWHCDLVTIHVYDPVRDLLIPPPTVCGVLHEEVEPDMQPSRVVRNLLERGPKLIVTEDTLADPLFATSRFRQQEEIVSCVVVRLQMSQQTVGMLFINYRKPHHFTEDELRHIELSANQAAVAIHNAQLFERQQRRTAALQALYQAGQAVTGSLNQQQILDDIAEQAWRLVSFTGRRVSYCSIWLVVDGSGAKVVSAFPRQELHKTRQALGPFVAWVTGPHGRTGIMHRAYKTGESQLVPNVDDDPDYLRSHKETRSELVVPIKLENDVVGIINVEHAEYAAFDNEDIRALEGLAAQAAIAMKNAQLYDTAVRQARLLHLASQVASHANSTLDEQKLLKKIVHVIATEFGFYHVAIFLMDEKQEYVVMRAASSENGQRLVGDGFQLKVGEQGLVGQVAQNGRYQIVADVSQNPHYLPNPLLRHTHSEATFPLIVRHKIIGVLDLQHRAQTGLQDDQIATLEMMTNQIANAIHNAQLYTQSAQQAFALQALYEAGQAVVESLDLKEILNNLVEQAWKLTGIHGLQAQFSCLLLQVGGQLHFEAAYPGHMLAALQDRPGSIDLYQPDRYGITGRAFKKGEPQLVDNVHADPNYLAYSNSTSSELAVPIKVEGHVVGVINVEHSQVRAFDEHDQNALVALAAQAGIAIQNANAYREARILQEVAALLTGAADMNEVMQLTLNAALEMTGTSSGSILYWDETRECFDPAYTLDGVGQSIRQYQTSARPRGFTRKVINIRRPVHIDDALYVTNVNPVVIQKRRRSLIGVPVLSEGKAIAVLHVYSPEPRHFSPHQVTTLETLAAQAGVAIAKMRSLEELQETKGKVGAYMALAWMSMASNAWRHSITADAVNIRNAADMVRGSLGTAVPNETHRNRIKNKLTMIHSLAERVMERPITPPLSSEDGANPIVINDLIRERTAQLWEDEKYAVLQFPTLLLAATENVMVWASAEWLRLALDLVVDNAIDAMKISSVQRLTIETSQNLGQVEIAIHDTGPGIPEALLPELFKGSLKKPRREGHLGRGLLMVQAIVQTYGGDVYARNAPEAGGDDGFVSACACDGKWVIG